MSVPEYVPYVFPESGTSIEAMQYAWRYAGNGAGGSGPRYRVARYITALECAGISSQGICHFDLGGGPGTFTWALLEWQQRNGQTTLKGAKLVSYDYAPAMGAVAKVIYQVVEQVLPNIPPLITYSNSHALSMDMCDIFAEQMGVSQHICITIGYVLAGNHEGQTGQAMIATFTGLICDIADMAEIVQTPCTLIVCDTESTRPSQDNLEPGWLKLTQSLHTGASH